MVVLLGAPVQDAAVAAGTDFPFELEVEIAELIAADEIGNLSVLRQHAVVDPPPRRHGVALVPAPRVERLAVEQHLHCGLRIADCGFI